MIILSCKQVTTKDGRATILVSTAERDIWIPVKWWSSKGGSSNLDAYIGGSINADFYAEGEVMNSGEACTTSDKILADFNVSMNPEVLARTVAVENNLRMEQALNVAALFKRKRQEALAKAAVAAEQQELNA